MVESLIILASAKEDRRREDRSGGSGLARAVLALAPATVGHDEVASKVHLEYRLGEDGGGALFNVVLLVRDDCEGEIDQLGAQRRGARKRRLTGTVVGRVKQSDKRARREDETGRGKVE
jgi:hypothetical protein